MRAKESQEKTHIKIEATVKTPVERVWKYWTEPEHIKKWNQASDDWHTPHAENDLRVGGKFLSRMEAKDGSFGFDFEGVYTEVENEQIDRLYNERRQESKSDFCAPRQYDKDRHRF